MKFAPENIYEREGRWYFQGYDVTDQPVWWLCDKGHEWEDTIKGRINGAGCPVCQSNQEVK